MTEPVTASLNTKLPEQEKLLFIKNAKALGLSPSAAIRVFVRAFNECQGFPFALQRSYPMSPQEKASRDELNAKLDAGTAQTYGSFGELLASIDAEIASESQA